jgi:ParB/RepB/Spo0J family partition protein
MAGAVMSKPKTQMIDLRDIVVQPNRMRQPRPEVVDELAASIEAEGLLQPIVVRPHLGAGFLLVAGWHRFEAKRKLKHETIECRVLDGLSADQARVAEIDENLIRAASPCERGSRVLNICTPMTSALSRWRSRKSSIELESCIPSRMSHAALWY